MKSSKQTSRKKVANPARKVTPLRILAAAAVVAVIALTGSWAVLWARPRSPFDGQRAYADLKRIVAIGPRVAGTEGGKKTQSLIKEELAKAGLEVREQPFTADTPLGPRAMLNLVGVVKGTQPGLVLLTNHYDTKYFRDFVFVGANDGGSTTAWMLEMARALGPRREGCTLWLCFFDGEEAFKEWTDTDSLYGSRAFVDRLKQTGDAAQVKAVVNVDMIGDCRLGIYQDPGAPAWLRDAVWSQAARLGYDDAFMPSGRVIEDDHIPFRRAGLPAMNLIDFEYGTTEVQHRNTWHTANDTLDKTCAASLQAVGDVIYHALPAIEAHKEQ
jgi:Zn-dependent M28 family amino/carboxypeptidase